MRFQRRRHVCDIIMDEERVTIEISAAWIDAICFGFDDVMQQCEEEDILWIDLTEYEPEEGINIQGGALEEGESVDLFVERNSDYLTIYMSQERYEGLRDDILNAIQDVVDGVNDAYNKDIGLEEVLCTITIGERDISWNVEWDRQE